MKILRFVIYLFDQYYSKGSTAGISYVSSLFAIVVLLFLNIMALLIFLGCDSILPVSIDESRISLYIKGIILVVVGSTILSLLVKERDIRAVNYDTAKLKRGKTLLLAYVITTIVLFFVSLLMIAKYSAE